ncbi:MAG TPA: prepilin-type N-terminal cleavage/methylation domain-containing protein [bacterium]|nr:prepilin-type N-terminal cleavage/methylation domain-containing protein [bacterium]
MIKHKHGFTLIELIITMIIIGILAGIAMVAIRVKTMEARDARRLADIKAVRLAMELSAASGETLSLPGNTSTLPSIRQLTGNSYLDFSTLIDPFFDTESVDGAGACLPDASAPCQYSFVDYDTGAAFASPPQTINPARYRVNFYEETAEQLSYATEAVFVSSQGSVAGGEEEEGGGGEEEEEPSLCVESGNALDDAATVVDASGITFGQYNKMKDKTKGNAKDNGWGHKKDGNDVWAEVSWSQGKLLNKLRLWSHFANGAEAIKDFQILGSNNRSTWAVLYTGTHPNEILNEFVDYTFANENYYKFYRINVLSNWPGDGDDEVGLDEFEMLCED